MKTRRNKAHLINYLLPLFLVIGTVFCGVNFSYAEEGESGEDTGIINENNNEQLEENLDEDSEENLDKQTGNLDEDLEENLNEGSEDGSEDEADAQDEEKTRQDIINEAFNNTKNFPIIDGVEITEEVQNEVIEKAKKLGRFKDITDEFASASISSFGNMVGASYDLVGPQFVYYDGDGFECSKEQRPGGEIPMPYCLNYEIKISVSGWIDNNFPRPGVADLEPIEGLYPAHWANLTEDSKNQLTSVYTFDARAKMYPDVPIAQFGQYVTFDFHLYSLSLNDFIEVYNMPDSEPEEAPEELPEIPNTGLLHLTEMVKATPGLGVSMMVGAIISSSVLFFIRRKY